MEAPDIPVTIYPDDTIFAQNTRLLSKTVFLYSVPRTQT